MTIVDAWLQHPNASFLQHEMFEPVRRWSRGTFPTGDLPLELTLAAMDAAGVERAWTCAWHGPEGELIGNDSVARHVAAHPDRLLGVAAVDLRRPAGAVRELRHAVEDLGFRALRVVPWLWGLPPNHRLYYPLYATCVELGIPFLTQVGHTGPLRTSETGRPIPYLDDVALEFPDLVVVGGHVGYPWTAEMVSLATKYPNVHIDTSAYTVRRYPPELVEFLRGHGRRKVLFGTNYPMLTPAKALEGLADLGLDDEARELFLHGNADRILPPR